MYIMVEVVGQIDGHVVNYAVKVLERFQKGGGLRLDGFKPDNGPRGPVNIRRQKNLTRLDSSRNAHVLLFAGNRLKSKTVRGESL
jgi:hypothetical protein